MQYKYVQFFSCDFKIDVKNCVWVLKGDGGDNDACNKTIYIDFKLIIVAFKFFWITNYTRHEHVQPKETRYLITIFVLLMFTSFLMKDPNAWSVLISFYSANQISRKKKSWSHCLLPKLEYVNKLSWDKFDTQREKVRQTSII